MTNEELKNKATYDLLKVLQKYECERPQAIGLILNLLCCLIEIVPDPQAKASYRTSAIALLSSNKITEDQIRKIFRADDN